MEPKTAIRSIVLPIAGPVDATWAELREALRASWAESTRCANWMLTELYARDVRRQPSEKKLGKMPRVYLYPEARTQFPSLASQTVASLEREVSRKYRARRYELLWLQSVSLPVMRYPVGLPLPSQMWRLEHDDGGTWLFSARIGDRRWRLRLRGGPHFYHHLKVIEAVAAGGLKAGAATLYQCTVHESDHRLGVTRKSRLLVRIPVDLPIRSENGRSGSLQVRTTRDALIRAGDPHSENAWIEHHNHIRRAIIAYERQRQHLADDLKAEKRWPARQCEGIVGRMGELGRRQRQRMESWLHEAAAHLVGYARRRRIAQIEYDDSDRSFVGLFPWAALRAKIAEKCEISGVKFVASGEVLGESQEALAEAEAK